MDNHENVAKEDLNEAMGENPSLKSFAAGDVIMYQGELADSAYIIEDGEVEIYVNRPNSVSLSIGTRGAGAIIGEMALIDDAPRTATIKAVTDCKLLEIKREEFTALLGETNPIVRMITKVILIRYRDTLKRTKLLRDPYEADSGAREIESAGKEALDALRASKEK